MSVSVRANDSANVVVGFRLPTGSASVVSVVGSFNDWTQEYVGRIAGDDVGYAGETDAGRRAAGKQTR